jgi:hypothetical protein
MPTHKNGALILMHRLTTTKTQAALKNNYNHANSLSCKNGGIGCSRDW